MTLGKLREFILEAGGKIKIGAVGITYSSGGDIDVHINHNLVSWIDGDHGDSVEIEDVVPTTSDDFNMDVVRNLKNDIRDYGNQIGELKTKTESLTFIDLFAGIGGFHLAFRNAGKKVGVPTKCAFVSEWNAHARKTYEHNFKNTDPELFTHLNRERLFVGDITKVNEKSIPQFDILTGGFPCQPFSHAGYKKGFSDVRGTLFYDIVRIIKTKKPSAFFLENVSHLLKHDNGKTFETIKRVIEEELGYTFFYKIVKASDFNVPQHRARLFMVGFKDKNIKFEFPKPLKLKKTMSDIFDGDCPKVIGYTLRVGGRGSGIKDRRNWDTYLVDGKERRLTPKEGKKMMGFPDSYQFPVTETQAMKQLGNAVAVPAIQATAEAILLALRKSHG